MSDENKKTPRKPDFEVEYVRGAGWDERESGGGLNFNFRMVMQEVSRRIDEQTKDDARQPEDKRREARRESNREGRRGRDDGPGYER